MTRREFRSDALSAEFGDSPYPHVYLWIPGSSSWINATRLSGGEKTGYVFFYALSFFPDGRPVVAYILTSDKETIHLMTYDEDTGQWTDGPSITQADLPNDRPVFGMFRDGKKWLLFQLRIRVRLAGMKFARDTIGNVYLYFKTYHRRDPWPDNTHAARLWILTFNGSDMHSYKVYITLDNVYGTRTTLQHDQFEDRSLGYVAFDLYSEHLCYEATLPEQCVVDLPHYAFCKEAYWITWFDRTRDLTSLGYLDRPNRCVPAIFRYSAV